MKSLTITKDDLKVECDRLEEERSIDIKTIEQARELKNKGFGFKELKQLLHTEEKNSQTTFKFRN